MISGQVLVAGKFAIRKEGGSPDRPGSGLFISKDTELRELPERPEAP